MGVARSTNGGTTLAEAIKNIKEDNARRQGVTSTGYLGPQSIVSGMPSTRSRGVGVDSLGIDSLGFGADTAGIGSPLSSPAFSVGLGASPNRDQSALYMTSRSYRDNLNRIREQYGDGAAAAADRLTKMAGQYTGRFPTVSTQPPPTVLPVIQRESERENNESDRQGAPTDNGREFGTESAFDNVSDTEGLDPDDYALGGRVGLAMGGAPGMASGFVDRPPEQVPEEQTVADNRPAQLPEGAFVINAAAVEFAGSKDVRDMLLDAHKEAIRTGLTVDKQGNGAKMIDVAISSGEVVVAPHLAKIIGYDRLEKINNRGKAETRERIQENGQQPVGAAEGGFLTYEGEMPDIGEDVPMDAQVSADTMQQFKAFTEKRRQRGDVERLIDSLDDRSALALAILTETIASRDTLESMEAVGQVIVNRANTNDPDFKDVNTVKEVLKQRSSRGEGSKMFQFDGLEPSSVRDRLKEITSGRAPDALNKVFAAADNVLSRQQPDAESYPTLPDHVLYYTKPGAAGAGFFENNPLLEPFSEIGGHSFYAKHLTKEFP